MRWSQKSNFMDIPTDAEVATAWCYYTTKNLVKMAELLGKQEDVKTYSMLAQKIKDVYRREFLLRQETMNARLDFIYS